MSAGKIDWAKVGKGEQQFPPPATSDTEKMGQNVAPKFPEGTQQKPYRIGGT